MVRCPLSGLQTFLYANYCKYAISLQSPQLKLTESGSELWKLSNQSKLDNSEGGYEDGHWASQSGRGGLNYNNAVMQLRKLCNHPYLLLEEVKTIPDELYFEVCNRCDGPVKSHNYILTYPNRTFSTLTASSCSQW